MSTMSSSTCGNPTLSISAQFLYVFCSAFLSEVFLFIYCVLLFLFVVVTL